jgi:hypothetical protein
VGKQRGGDCLGRVGQDHAVVRGGARRDQLVARSAKHADRRGCVRGPRPHSLAQDPFDGPFLDREVDAKWRSSVGPIGEHGLLAAGVLDDLRGGDRTAADDDDGIVGGCSVRTSGSIG